MDSEELKRRTKEFALRILKLCAALPRNGVTNVLSKQLMRSATSVGANYRAACRARSRADFANKIGIVEEEADESAYWIELLTESGQIDSGLVEALHSEAVELTAIAAASRRTARHAPNRQSSIDNRQSE